MNQKIMEGPENISRNKRIYLFILLLNFITSALRVYFFPGQSLFFHAVLFVGTFIVIALYWETVLILGKWLERPFPISQRPESRIIIQIIITFIISVIIGAIFFWGAEIYFNVITPDSLAFMTPVLNLFTALIFNLIYFGIYYFQEWKRNLIRSERILREQAQVQYNALRNQLNPHFLFNALTSLNSLIFENQQLASNFLKQLSKVYRYTLQNQHNEVVLLRKEIEFVEHYISLLKTRFGDAIDFVINIDSKSMDKSIVPVTTQMMIENAVKHNIISPVKPLRILFTTEEELLVIQNNVNRKQQIETSNRLGLENLKALYNYLSAVPIQVIQSEDFFTIKIPLI